MDFRDSDKGKGVQENGQEINEIERSKIGIMRALIDREDPSAKVLPLFFSACSATIFFFWV